MTYEELQNQIAEIVGTSDFQLVRSSYDNFSLQVDGEWFAHDEPAEMILWAIQNPEEYQSQRDADIEALLADLTATVKGD